jgi:hypothetical protein
MKVKWHPAAGNDAGAFSTHLQAIVLDVSRQATTAQCPPIIHVAAALPLAIGVVNCSWMRHENKRVALCRTFHPLAVLDIPCPWPRLLFYKPDSN